MSRRLPTRPADKGWARGRRGVAVKYVEVAELIDSEDDAINVCVGLAILAGIAAGDAICAASMGERYSGADHASAAALLERTDRALGTQLRVLIRLKPAAHYGNDLLKPADRTKALRAARSLVDEATKRTT